MNNSSLSSVICCEAALTHLRTEKTFKNEQRSKDAAAKKDLIQVE